MEYRDNSSKTSGSLYKFCNEPYINITYSESLRFKSKFLENTINADLRNAKRAVPLKFLSNFLRTLQMALINCEIILIPTWSAN